MSESLITKGDRKKEDWIEIFETNRRGKDKLKKDKIVCQERVNKIDREIDLLIEKKQPELVKLSAIESMLKRLDKESNNIEIDRLERQNRRLKQVKKEKELKLFYSWRKENRKDFGIEVQNKIFDGIDIEGLTFNKSLIRYIAYDKQNENVMRVESQNDLLANVRYNLEL